jgi:hypothetical protein
VIIGSEDRRAARGDRRGPFRRRGEPTIRPDQMILLGTEERRRHHFFYRETNRLFSEIIGTVERERWKKDGTSGTDTRRFDRRRQRFRPT